MIAERLPLFNGRLKSDVDNCRPEPSTMTDAPEGSTGVGLEGRATDGYAFNPVLKSYF